MKITTKRGYEFFHDMLMSKKLIPRFFCINEKCDTKFYKNSTKLKYHINIENAFLILKGIKGIIEFDLTKIKIELESVRELVNSLKNNGNYISLGNSGFFDKEGLVKFEYTPRKSKKDTSGVNIEYSDTNTYNHYIAFNSGKVDVRTLYESMIGINKTRFVNRDYLFNNYIAKDTSFEIDGFHCGDNDPVVSLVIRLYYKYSDSKNWDYYIYITEKESSIDHKSDLKLIMKNYKNEIAKARETAIKEFDKLIPGGKNDNHA